MKSKYIRLSKSSLPCPKDMIKNGKDFYYVVSAIMGDSGNLSFLCVKYGTTLQVKILQEEDIAEILKPNDIKNSISALHIHQTIDDCLINYHSNIISYWLTPNGYRLMVKKDWNCFIHLYVPYTLDSYHLTADGLGGGFCYTRTRIIGKLEYDISQMLSNVMEKLTNGEVHWGKFDYRGSSTSEKLIELFNKEHGVASIR